MNEGALLHIDSNLKCSIIRLKVSVDKNLYNREIHGRNFIRLDNQWHHFLVDFRDQLFIRFEKIQVLLMKYEYHWIVRPYILRFFRIISIKFLSLFSSFHQSFPFFSCFHFSLFYLVVIYFILTEINISAYLYLFMNMIITWKISEILMYLKYWNEDRTVVFPIPFTY